MGVGWEEVLEQGKDNIVIQWKPKINPLYGKDTLRTLNQVSAL